MMHEAPKLEARRRLNWTGAPQCRYSGRGGSDVNTSSSLATRKCVRPPRRACASNPVANFPSPTRGDPKVTRIRRRPMSGNHRRASYVRRVATAPPSECPAMTIGFEEPWATTSRSTSSAWSRRCGLSVYTPMNPLWTLPGKPSNLRGFVFMSDMPSPTVQVPRRQITKASGCSTATPSSTESAAAAGPSFGTPKLKMCGWANRRRTRANPSGGA
mmetsp:Transcript_5109/g.9136  ORF Transcript_5109/g.9136 Transcript_5109/m.9136 type:complete len:215 (-) Transcript_5109:21-665(-)